MKKELKNKLIFISGVAFALALLFVSVQMIQAGWTAPTVPFPGGEIYPPIDTSSSTQTKAGGLILGTGVVPGSVLRIQKGQGLAVDAVDGGSFYPSQGTVGAVLNSSNGFYVNTSGLVLPRIPRVATDAPYADVEGMIYYDTVEKSVKLFNGKWVDIGSGGGESYWKAITGGIAYTGGDIFAGLDGKQWVYVSTGNEYECFVQGPTNDRKLILGLPINKAFAKEECSQYDNAKMSCDNSASSIECTESFYIAGGSSDKSTRYDTYQKPGDQKGTYRYKAFGLVTRVLDNTTKLSAAALSASKSICLGSDCRTQWPGGSASYATISGHGGICMDHYLAIKYNTDGDKTSFNVSGTNPGGTDFGNNCGAMISPGSWRYSKSGGAMQVNLQCGTSRTELKLCPWGSVMVKFKKEGDNHFVMASDLIEITMKSNRESFRTIRCGAGSWCPLNDRGVSANGSYFSFLNIVEGDPGSGTFESSSFIFGPERLSYE